VISTLFGRYNVTSEALSAASSKNKVEYFEGLPIPTNLLNVVLLGFAYKYGAIGSDNLWGGKMEVSPGHFHPLSLIYLFTGLCQIATFRIPKPDLRNIHF
jgi:phosphatidylserine synthase